MKFRPLHDRVVVRRLEAEEKSAGGIIIPDTALVHSTTKVEMAPNPSCYAMVGWRRTESGRPAASIRFSTATPMAASVC
jgi:hypothetical protein